MKIAAITMVKNEWPMIALSIVSLLEQGVDEVFLVDNGSIDGTWEGLNHMIDLGMPIHAVRDDSGTFYQSATTNYLARMAVLQGADWILPFDADEFWIPKEESSRLSSVLQGINPETTVVRVEVVNYLVPRSTMEFKPNVLAQVRKRAVFVVPEETEEVKQAVAEGKVPFVCAPFGAKVIFRPAVLGWLHQGGHRVSPFDGRSYSEQRSDKIFVAHLPFYDRKKIEKRVQHGDTVRKGKTGKGQSWHLKLMADSAGGKGLSLDEWWTLNSAPDGVARSDSEQALFQQDDRIERLARRLLPVFHRYGLRDDYPGSRAEKQTANIDEALPVRAAVSTIREFEEQLVRLYFGNYSDRKRSLFRRVALQMLLKE